MIIFLHYTNRYLNNEKTSPNYFDEFLCCSNLGNCTLFLSGTIDPSPFLYNNTMYTMAGLVSVGAALHFLVRPVNKKYFEKA